MRTAEGVLRFLNQKDQEEEKEGEENASPVTAVRASASNDGSAADSVDAINAVPVAAVPIMKTSGPTANAPKKDNVPSDNGGHNKKEEDEEKKEEDIKVRGRYDDEDEIVVAQRCFGCISGAGRNTGSPRGWNNEPAKTLIDTITHNPATTKHLHYDWNDLLIKARTAASMLGYDESNWGSNNSEWAEAEWKWWEKLTPKEQYAATSLGWDQHAWDTFYEDTNWDDLPDDIQGVVADVLGFTRELWDGNEWPESTDKWWSEFTDEEKLALNTLGYRHYDWE